MKEMVPLQDRRRVGREQEDRERQWGGLESYQGEDALFQWPRDRKSRTVPRGSGSGKPPAVPGVHLRRDDGVHELVEVGRHPEADGRQDHAQQDRGHTRAGGKWRRTVTPVRNFIEEKPLASFFAASWLSVAIVWILSGVF